MREPTALQPQNTEVKQCCASFYGSDFARFLLGESFHPGGAALTRELGERLGLSPASRVLDVAAGRGASALLLAQTFGCKVVGVDLSEENVRLANEAAVQNGSDLARFQLGDAESLPFEDRSFDAVICECAFCTFPDKPSAAREVFRVLRPGGSLGLSDLTRATAQDFELDSLLAWIACVADAAPLQRYAEWLAQAGFAMTQTAERSACLRELLDQVRGRLLLADVLAGLGKLGLPGVDISRAKAFLSAAGAAVAKGELGYALLIADRPIAHP